MKSKRRSIESVDDETLPVYNVSERCGPYSRGYVEVKLNQIMERAWKKNLLWILVCLRVPWVSETFLARFPVSVKSLRCVGLQPTPKIPAAREKNLWYPG